jgi:hypothetical protein
VTVNGRLASQHALLAESFESLDSTSWRSFGQPPPSITEVAGDRVLELLGDGVGRDGIVSLAGFDLSRGATLELSYRLPLTRDDRQGIGICLTSGATPLTPGYERASRGSEGVCFEHPAAEQSHFDPTTYLFRTQGDWSPVLRSSQLPSSGWQRVAIILAADGTARLLINQNEVARLQWPVYNGPEVQWHVEIGGRAADTRLFIRDLVLWEGVRY